MNFTICSWCYLEKLTFMEFLNNVDCLTSQLVQSFWARKRKSCFRRVRRNLLWSLGHKKIIMRTRSVQVHWIVTRPEKAKKMAEAAFQFVNEKFDWEKVNDRLAEIITGSSSGSWNSQSRGQPRYVEDRPFLDQIQDERMWSALRRGNERSHLLCW